VADQGKTIVIAVIVGIGLALVRCELRKERRADRGPSAEQVEAEERVGRQNALALEDRERRALAQVEQAHPPLSGAVAAYSGPTPAYPAGPRFAEADNAKVVHRMVRSLVGFEARLTPDQVRRVRTTLYVAQDRYREVLFGGGGPVDALLRAEMATFLAADELRGFLVATEGSPAMLLGLGDLTVPAPAP
jgi:hypothetical protein